MLRFTFIALSLVTAAGCTDADQGVTLDDLEARPAIDGKADTWPIACVNMQPSFASLDGIAGSYLRSFPYANGEITSITLSPAPEGTGAYSGFARRNGVVAAETGRFFAMTDNPALGAVLALDRQPLNAEPWADEIYWILGSRKDLTGKVQGLCLAKAADSDGNVNGVPFGVMRVGL